MNVVYTDQYDDIYEKVPHQASRVVKPGSPMTKKMDRSYGDKLRKQIREARNSVHNGGPAEGGPTIKPVRMEQE